jgi:hypothetical protein
MSTFMINPVEATGFLTAAKSALDLLKTALGLLPKGVDCRVGPERGWPDPMDHSRNGPGLVQMVPFGPNVSALV